MRGHVFKRGSTWSFIQDVGRRADGRRQQTLKGGFATKREAQAALSESLSLVAKGIVQDAGRLTLREYLVDQWLPSRCTTCGRTRGCRTRRRLHLLPHLGDRQLRRLTRSDCDSLYVRLQKPDPVTGRSLSAAIIRRVHAILHAALSAAVQRGLVGHNVSDHVRLPRAPKPRLATWTPEQLQRFLEATQGDRLGPLYLLLAQDVVAGADVVVLAMHGFVGPGGVSPRTVDQQGSRNVIAAAEQADADVVLASIAGASATSPLELARVKYGVEEHLRTSRRRWTVVRADAFAQTWFDVLEQTAAQSHRLGAGVRLGAFPPRTSPARTRRVARGPRVVLSSG